MSSEIIDNSLFDHIEPAQKDSIPSPVIEKLLVKWNGKCRETSHLESEREKLLIDHEQQKFILENEVVELKNKLKDEGSAKAQAVAHRDLLEAKNKTLENDLQVATERINVLLREIEGLGKEKDDLSTRNVSLSALVDNKTTLITELESNLSSIEIELQKVLKEKIDLAIKAEDASLYKVQFEMKEKGLLEEKNLYERQVGLLQNQLKEDMEEVCKMRHQHASLLLTLQGDLDHSVTQVKFLTEERDALQKSDEEKRLKIQSLLESLNKARESEVKLEETYGNELSAQERLANIYKVSCEDKQKQCEELEKGIEELRQLLQEASEQFSGLEKAKKKSEEEAQLALDEKTILIDDLRDELQKVNAILEAKTPKDDLLSDMYPSAAAAKNLLNKGLTLSQFYNEYMTVSEKLLHMEQEKNRLERYLDQILQEFEEKAPSLKRQKEDYQYALETNSILRDEIQQYKDELCKQREAAEEAQRRSNYIGRENDSLTQQIQDLSKQVTILLTQVESARSGLPPPPAEVFENHDSSSQSNELISQHFVSFRNVKELQEQNQKLLVTVRDLADKLDSAEKSAVDEKTKELSQQLEANQARLSELTDERSKMHVMLEQLKSSRDALKTLIDQKPVHAIPQQSSSPIANKNVEQLQKELAEAKKEIANLEKSHEVYRTERDKNYQIEVEEYKKMKVTFEKTKNDNTRLLSLAEYNEERLKVLQKNCDSYQRQLKALEERNTQWQGVIARHETTIETLRNELKDVFKRLTQAEIATSSLREEKIFLKESEARLRAERDSLQSNQMSQNKIWANLEAIKINLERKDSGDKMRQQNHIADLTNECSKLKAKIESNTDLKEAGIKIDGLEQSLSNSKTEYEKINKELLQAQEKLESVTAQLQEAQENLRTRGSPQFIGRPGMRPKASPTSTPVRPSGSLNSSVRELQVQLNEEKARVASLQNTLEQAQTNIDNLSKLSNQQSSQLQEASEADKKLKEENGRLRNQMEEKERSIGSLKESLQNSQQSEKAVKIACDSQLMKMTEDLEERENELDEVQKKLTWATQMKEEAVALSQKNASIASEAQDKYEREVMLHGADLQALTTLKQRLAALTSEVESHEKAKMKADQELNDLNVKLEEKSSLLSKTNKELSERINELETQNKSLVENFSQLSDKMSGLEMKLLSSGEGVNTSFTEDDARSADQLREVIKYLRRERELASTNLNVTQSEVERLKAQKKSLEEQLNLITKHLAEERQKNQGQSENTAKQNELMRKVQTIDALTDSNRILREEKESLKNNLDENMAKVASLQTQIEPLQDKIKDATQKIDVLMVDKKGLSEEKELYKKRTQELVEKLNKARPEDQIKLQQELSALQKNMESKQAELIRTRSLANKAQKTLQDSVQARIKLEQKVEESKAIHETNSSLKHECERLRNQLTQSMDKVRKLDANMNQTQSAHQKEVHKIQEYNNQLLKEIVEFRQREEELRLKTDALNSQLEEKDNKIKTLESENATARKNLEILERQILQLRKIATKYKKMAETKSSEGDQGEEASNDASKDEQLGIKKEEEAAADQGESSGEMTRKTEQKDAEILKLQNELQKVNAGQSQTAKRLEESQRKLSAYESQILATKKEKEQQSQHIEGLQKKLLMQQRMIENLQKQGSIASKGSTSGINVEKVTDTPPTANIKPMAAPVAAVASRSQGATQSGSSSSRSIPTASIRPMAPSPAGQSTSIVVVPPMEAHSAGDGAVSSTVTLPQATVTPTPAVPTSTSTQPFSFALTATVSPTPLSTSIANTGEILQQPPPSSSIGAGIQPSALSVHSSTSNVAAVAPASVSQVACMPVTPIQGQESNGNTADSIISQVIALVAPHGDLLSDEPLISTQPQSSGSSSASASSSRKRKLDENQDDEEAKRSCVEVHDVSREGTMEEDAGEPSSSSSQVGDKRVSDDDEILIVPSDDDEEAAPSSHSRSSIQESEVRMNEDDPEEGTSQKRMVIMEVQGGREAEVQLRSFESEAEQRHEEQESPEGQEQVSLLSSFQQPSQPGRGAIHMSQEQPTSSRQSVLPFQQLTQFEETDDRLVPSTPTLIIPRQGDFVTGEGVSSPQVPSQGFIFGGVSSEAVAPSNMDSAQIIEGGTIDVTRMDLAQLDDGSHKSTAVAAARSSPSIKKVEVSSEGNISSSAGEGSSEVGSSPVKTFHDAASFSGERRPNQDEPDSGVEEVEAEEKDEQGEFGSTKPGMSGDESSQPGVPAEDDDSSSSQSIGIPEESTPHQMPPQSRSTRSSQRQAVQPVPVTQRRITPIVYETERPQRGTTYSRGARVEHPQGRGQSQDLSQGGRLPGARGSAASRAGRSTARRSRPHRGSYGSM